MDEKITPSTESVMPGTVEGEIQPSETAENKTSAWSLIYEVLETVLLAAVIWLGVNFATARFIVEGSSMEPNFHTGQMLIVSRLAYKLWKPERGDVIVFQYPGNPVDDYIKRVIGVPGDTVIIRGGRVIVNQHVLTEPYLSPQTQVSGVGEWQVPPNSYFVLGDNRQHSSDSRIWGMLSRDYIIGKAWLSYWPPKYWGVVPQAEYGEPSP